MCLAWMASSPSMRTELARMSENRGNRWTPGGHGLTAPMPSWPWPRHFTRRHLARSRSGESPRTQQWRRHRREGWRLLTLYADYWLRAADVRPWPQFQNGQVRLTLGSDWGHSPLFGAIAVQLVLAISGVQGFAVCDACRNVYAPRRTPRAGECHYCEACRDRKVAQRLAAARYRRGETKKRG
jgi:hypothetical protein